MLTSQSVRKQADIKAIAKVVHVRAFAFEYWQTLNWKTNHLPRLTEVKRVYVLEDDEEHCEILSFERDFALLNSAVVITGLWSSQLQCWHGWVRSSGGPPLRRKEGRKGDEVGKKMSGGRFRGSKQGVDMIISHIHGWNLEFQKNKYFKEETW